MTAVVLAGERGGEDPVARSAGVACKALTPVGGRPMILRVLDALEASEAVGPILLCGPSPAALASCEELRRRVDGGEVRWMACRPSPCLSVEAALEGLPAGTPVLVTTADHALLDARMVDRFCSEARSAGGDLAVGVAPHEAVMAAFPGMRRTAFRLRDGSWCGCNLFALLTVGSRRAVEFWRSVERARKRPLKVAGIFGWSALLAYLLRRLTLPEALRRVSGRMRLAARAVVLPYPEAAVDVDTVDDWSFVQGRLGEVRICTGGGT